MNTEKVQKNWILCLLSSLVFIPLLVACGGPNSTPWPTFPAPPESYYENPYQNLQYWYKGNTHTHTKASDGDYYYPQVLALYDQTGYDFVVITDHNKSEIVGGGSGKSTDRPPYQIEGFGSNTDILWINNSCESGDSYEHHISAIGLKPNNGLRNCPEECGSNEFSGLTDCDGVENQKRINQALEQNGLVFLNHPYEWGKYDIVNLGWPVEEMLQMEGYHGVEIANSYYSCFFKDTFFPAPCSLYGVSDLVQRTVIRDVDAWIYLLNKGRMVWGVASDDFHGGEPAKKGWIIVNSSAIINNIQDMQSYESGNQDILTNIRNGNFYSVIRGENGDKEGPEFTSITTIGKNLMVVFRGASKVRFLDCQGLLMEEDVSTKNASTYIAESSLRIPQSYLRIELENQTGNIAYSQPLHVIGAGACPNIPVPPPTTPTCEEGYYRCGVDCIPNDSQCP